MRKSVLVLALMLCFAAFSGQAQEEWVQARVINCQEWVSLRESPSTSAPRLVQVPLGETVQAKAYDHQFALCRYGDLEGYILTKYLSLPPAGMGQAAQDTLIPNVKDYLSLRSSPEGKARVIQRIKPGTPMKVLGWKNLYAHVQALDSGAMGYVHSGHVADPGGDTGRWPYDHEYMMSDLAGLGLETHILGYSLDDRPIPVARWGTGDVHILIQAGIHGRELMTSRLAVDLLARLMEDHPQGIEGVTFHVIPMVNPDGVTIAVHGPQAIAHPDLRARAEDILAREGGDYRQWKANARGVDLNRNFPTGWESLSGRTPGSARYRGEKPLSEPESRALADYFLQYDFSATVSYHSYGSVIYWQGARGALEGTNSSLAQLMGQLTGYPLINDEMDNVERGGFKDWALMDHGVPSITVEVGALDPSGSIYEYTGLLVRHKGSWEQIAGWARAQ